MIHLTVQSRGALERTFDGAPKDTLSDLHKDAQKGAYEVALELHLWLHLLLQWLVHKFAQNGSSNGGPDAPLEGKFGDGLNVGFEWPP